MSPAALHEPGREYYPGTSTPITVRTRTSEPQDDDDLFARPRTDYTVNGRPFHCFAVGVLARAMNRHPVTIRRWEKEGVLPKTSFRSPKTQGKGSARLYTREQIEGIVEIAKDEGLYDGSKPVAETKFTERVRQLFVDIDASYRGAKS